MAAAATTANHDTTFYKKPRGRPPKNKQWDKFIGKYVTNSPPPPSNTPENNVASSTRVSSSHSWDSDEMNDLVFDIGRKQNPYRTCTKKQRDASGQYMPGFYYDRKKKLNRSISEQGAQIFVEGLETPTKLKKSVSDQGLHVVAWKDNLRSLPYPLYGDDFSPHIDEDKEDKESDVFVTRFLSDIDAWYKRKNATEKHFLNTNEDCRTLSQLMIHALDNYLAMSGYFLRT